MDNPESYKRSSMKHAKVPYLLIFRRYWRSLLAVSASWFLYDIISSVPHSNFRLTPHRLTRYPFGLYSSTVVDSIIGNTSSLEVIFGWSVIINLFYMWVVIPFSLTDY
jgi:hypothetical protein